MKTVTFFSHLRNILHFLVLGVSFFSFLRYNWGSGKTCDPHSTSGLYFPCRFIILLLWIFRYCSLSSETLAVSLRKKVIQV